MRRGSAVTKTAALGLAMAACFLGMTFSPLLSFAQRTDENQTTRKVRSKVEPKYPILARQYQWTGSVKIELTVSPSGLVSKTRLLGGNPVLAGPALEAAKQWKYEAAQTETIEIAEFVFDFRNR